MTSRHASPGTVEVTAYQQGEFIILDWRVYRSKALNPVRRPSAHSRVRIRHAEPLSEIQLTVLAGRMVAYILARRPGHQFVPRHLPWQEVGATEWSVPPGGGEGGANRPGDAGLTEGTI